MSISAMKQAVKALECAAGLISPITKGCQCQICLAHTALRQAIAEAEKQEPAFYVIQATDRFGEGYEQTYWEDPNGFPVYAAPPKREWVGLTDEEKSDIDAKSIGIRSAMYLTEATLKEKNK